MARYEHLPIFVEAYKLAAQMEGRAPARLLWG